MTGHAVILFHRLVRQMPFFQGTKFQRLLSWFRLTWKKNMNGRGREENTVHTQDPSPIFWKIYSTLNPKSFSRMSESKNLFILIRLLKFKYIRYWNSNWVVAFVGLSPIKHKMSTPRASPALLPGTPEWMAPLSRYEALLVLTMLRLVTYCLSGFFGRNSACTNGCPLTVPSKSTSAVLVLLAFRYTIYASEAFRP